MQPEPLIAFGPVRVDPANQRVLRGEISIDLRPKAYALLRYLIANPERIVTKEELLDAVWPDTIVGDSVLKVCVRELRLALGDDQKAPRYIETVHRRGYRFLVRAESAPTQVHAAARTPSPPAEAAPVLVGREPQLKILQAAFERASAGDRQLLFITGEPGIGKTSLVNSFCAARVRAAEALPIEVARGQCLEQFGAGEAFHAFLEALGRLCRGARGIECMKLLRERAPTWFVQMPWLLTTADREQLQREVHGATAERMLREMAEFLEVITRETPLILVLEDFHWCDLSTLNLLSALARRPEAARLLTLVTYRPIEVILSEHPLKRIRRELELQGNCEEVPLELLSEQDFVELVDARLAPADAPQGLVSWLHARTDGNPLFHSILLDHLIERELVTEHDGSWRFDPPGDDAPGVLPRSLRELLDQQVERCSEEERVFLEAASLASHEFSALAVANALAGRLDTEAIAEHLARTGQFVVELDLTEFPDGSFSPCYRFIHAIYADVLAARLTPARRARYMRDMATGGEKLFGEQAGEIANELAECFTEGRAYAKALEYHRLAAARAARRFANREALEHLERAQLLIERLDSGAREEARRQVLEEIGVVARSMGDMRAADQAFEELARAARESHAPDREARALLLSASALSWIDREGCLSQVARADALAPALDDQLLRAHIGGSAGYWHLLWEGYRASDAVRCEEALAAARAAGDRDLIAVHQVRFAFFQALRSDYEAAEGSASAALEGAPAASDTFDNLLAEFYRCWALRCAGRLGSALGVARAAQHDAEQNGHAHWSILFRVLAAWVHEQAGDFVRARDIAQGAFDDALRMEHHPSAELARTVLAAALLGDGAAESARELLAQSALAGEERFLLDWICAMFQAEVAARCALETGELGEAEAHALELTERATACGERSLLALAHATRAECALTDGRPAQAQEPIDAALDALDGLRAPAAAARVHALAAKIAKRRRKKAQAEYHAQAGAVARDQLERSLKE